MDRSASADRAGASRPARPKCRYLLRPRDGPRTRPDFCRPARWRISTAGLRPSSAPRATRCSSAIAQTTGDTPTEDWTVRAFAAWKVGSKGLDDGLILFVFAKDKKVRIEVGYGLEGVVPDAIASRIINEVIVPRIQSGDRDAAVTAGIEALTGVVSPQAGGTSGEDPYRRRTAGIHGQPHIPGSEPEPGANDLVRHPRRGFPDPPRHPSRPGHLPAVQPPVGGAGRRRRGWRFFGRRWQFRWRWRQRVVVREMWNVECSDHLMT